MIKLPELVDIYDSFDIDCNTVSILTVDEIVSLCEGIYGIIDEYMMNHMMNIKLMSFDEQLKQYVMDNLEPFIYDVLEDIDEDEITTLLEEVYEYTRKDYFSLLMPPRSYPRTFIRRMPQVQNMENQIQFLRNKPQPDQRTNEWYEFRYNLLTASSIWKAFSSQNTKNQLIYEKCKPLNLEKYQNVNTESALHHGQKYEELSIMYYEKVYKTKVEDFGCIQHDKYPFIGASPDGINVDPSSPRYGRMLEIKNIVNREITGIPKEEYWIQMQVQMETCGLNECDFLETQFSEYESEEEFLQDNSSKLKGLLLYFMENGKPLYKYMPLELDSHEAMTEWENKTIDDYSHLTWIKTIYWRLDKVSCVLVLRNKQWFKEALPFIQELWSFVEKERKEGFEHRAPKRQQRKRASSFVNIETEEKGCLVDPCLFDSDFTINTEIINQCENIVIEKNSGELFTDLSFNTNSFM